MSKFNIFEEAEKAKEREKKQGKDRFRTILVPFSKIKHMIRRPKAK